MDDDNVLVDLTDDAMRFIGIFASQINKCAKEFMRHFPEKELSYQDSKIEDLFADAYGHMNQIRDIFKILDELNPHPKRYKFSELVDETKKEIEDRVVDITNFLMMIWTKIE